MSIDRRETRRFFRRADRAGSLISKLTPLCLWSEWRCILIEPAVEEKVPGPIEVYLRWWLLPSSELLVVEIWIYGLNA